MPINIEMPKLSDTMTEGTLIKWHKEVGDAIEIGDILADIETDKATMEMEAFDEGTLAEILVTAGGKGAVGSVIAVIAEEGEEISDASGSAENSSAAEAKKDDSSAEKSEKSTSDKDSPVEEAKASPSPKRGAGERIFASPLARKIAEDQGIDLSSLTGTGPGGRIVQADVKKGSDDQKTDAAKSYNSASDTSNKAAPAQNQNQSAAPAAQAILPTVGEDDKRVELSTMRKIIADRLLTSKTTIPHFYLHMEVDMAALMSLRSQINVQSEQTHGNKYTINDFIVKAMINAAVAVPEVNASYNKDHIVQFKHVGISVAVAIDDGLVTPVVKKAEEKSLLQISKEIKDLATRARDKKLKPNEFDGGTITISNLGAWGVDSFDAIVNPPQAAILSVGGISEKPVVVNGSIVVGTRMNVGLSCDHRVVDGAVGAKYLGEIKRLLENPALMLI